MGATAADDPITIDEPAAPRDTWFRGDIDGLRAVAILLVVAYHANVPKFNGGFIGVDVFFVISGFLISRNLLREADTTERVHLGGFWARRVRRLVPALALVVAVTLAAGTLILPLFRHDTLATQGVVSILYVSNLYFATQAQDYFAADIASSPFLHTWSLGVEEQFYVVWPLLFALVTWAVARGATRRADSSAARRRALVVTFAVTLVASLALAVVLTGDDSPWAFFGLPSRAWEFAAAGLLAAVAVPDALRSTALRTAGAIVGVLLLAFATFTFDAATPYPGWRALFPVVGTVLLIVAGETWGGAEPTTAVSRLASLPPAQWLGRVSYSWYLWHWPFIVLAVASVESATRTVTGLAAAASLPVAWAAYRWVETPLRFAAPITRSLTRTFAFGAAVTAAVLLGTVAVRPDIADYAAERTGPLDPADLEAPPGSSLDERVAVAVAELESRADRSCPLEDGLTTPQGDEYCVDGALGSDTSVLLLGDSHAGQWRRALEEVAEQEGVELLIRQHSGCPPYRLDIIEPGGDDKREVCADAQEGNLRVIDALDPDAIIISTWSGYQGFLRHPDGSTPTPDEEVAMWGDAVAELTAAIDERGIPLAAIIDAPTLPFDAATCLATEGSIEACAISRGDALAQAGGFLAEERRTFSEIDAPVIDMTDVVCDEERCFLEKDGSLVFVDRHHLSGAFAARQVPLLTDLVDEVLTRTG